ncbi:unnamed protein product [Caenorhabditis sp. 36 PRJEB53466]|nr:unnamed protein product [Caenorhabditis sp. 36 PRJEB53466]
MLIPSIILFSLIALAPVNAYNVLVYSPSFGGSHTNFMARLADTLTEAGHNVTFLVPVVDEARKGQLGVKKTKDVVVVEQDEEMKRQIIPIDDDMEQYWTTDIDSSNAETLFSTFNKAFFLSCNNLVRNKKVFNEMKARKFDVGIFEPVSVCGMGFANALGIKKTILASSCTMYDAAVDAVGETLDLSYVPVMMSKFGEKMNILERLENLRMARATSRMQQNMWDEETRIYRKSLGNEVPHWRDLLPAASVFFTNSIPYMDFPRSVTQKTVPIGGISVDIASIKSQKLPIEWSTVLDERPYSMLISFGSMVRSMDMPKEWRSNLLEAIRSEPNVTFIWKYESDDLGWAEGVQNIHFSKWVPQTALLNDDRLTAFMTHGGLGSTNELAHLGKPALMVPVFADQDRNANMLARHGGVSVIHRKELGNAKRMRAVICSVLHEEKYKRNARKLADLLANQPMKPKEQVVKYTEFVAKFGPFPEMDSYGRKLGFIEKNFVDIYFFIGLSYLLIFAALYFSVRFVFSRISFKLVKKD